MKDQLYFSQKQLSFLVIIDYSVRRASYIFW